MFLQFAMFDKSASPIHTYKTLLTDYGLCCIMVIIVVGGGVPSPPAGSEEGPPTKPSSPAPLPDCKASLLQRPHAFTITHQRCGDGVVVLGPASTVE